jgi:outer membrane receptor protein involved in Fe transport
MTWTPARGPRLSLTGLYTGETPMQRDEAGIVTGTRDAFARLDARVAQRLPAGLELTLGADNVFDARPAAWADAVGRQWYVGLAWNTNSLSRD